MGKHLLKINNNDNNSTVLIVNFQVVFDHKILTPRNNIN